MLQQLRALQLVLSLVQIGRSIRLGSGEWRLRSVAPQLMEFDPDTDGASDVYVIQNQDGSWNRQPIRAILMKTISRSGSIF